MAEYKETQLVLCAPQLRHCPHVRMFGYRRMRAAGNLGQHLNEGIEICLLSKGRFEWTIEDHAWQLRSGDCTFTMPWQRHGGTHGLLDAGSLHWIIIAPQRFHRDGTLSLGRWSRLPADVQHWIGQTLCTAEMPFVAADDAIRHIFHELHEIFRTNDPSVAWRINLLIDELLYCLARSVSTSQTVRRNVLDMQRVRQRVTADLSRRWTLDDLVAITGYGKTRLTHLVRTETGLSPMALIRRLRIDAAQQALRTSSLDITDIALRCGFQSSQQFATIFRRLIGHSPSTWRKLSGRIVSRRGRHV